MRANEVRAWFGKRGGIAVALVITVLAVGAASWLPVSAGKTPRSESDSKDKKEESDCTCPGQVIAVPGGRTFAIALGEKGAYLGVMLDDEAIESEEGVRITQVIPDTPADKAGLEDGDVIVRFEGQAIGGALDLTKQIRASEAGDRVSITVRRDGHEKKMEVELGERSQLAGAPVPYVAPFGNNSDWSEWKQDLEAWKEEMAEEGGRSAEHWRDFARQFAMPRSKPKLGVQLVETTRELRLYLGGKEDAGVLVGKVLADTPAERAGIRVGDLIVSVDGESVQDAEDLIEELDDKDGERFPIQVVRDGKTLTIEVAIPEPEDEEEARGPRAMVAPRPPTAPAPPPPIAAFPAPPAPPAAPAPPGRPAPMARPSGRVSV